jgi:hypothetical protein
MGIMASIDTEHERNSGRPADFGGALCGIISERCEYPLKLLKIIPNKI